MIVVGLTFNVFDTDKRKAMVTPLKNLGIGN